MSLRNASPSDTTSEQGRYRLGPDMVILGSGSIVSQLAQEGLIDAYQIVVNPIVLGRGKTMFEDIRDPLKLKLAGTRSFRNGNVLLDYENLERE